MGVVRRDGDWRLEKRGEGHYEITYQEEPIEIVLTEKYDAGSMGSLGAPAVGLPDTRVNSFQGAVGRFQERAGGQPPAGFGPELGLGWEGSRMDSDSTGSDLDLVGNDLDEVDLGEGSPGGLAFALLVVGAIFIWTSDFAFSSLVFQIGALAVLLGVFIIGVAVVTSDDTWGAVERLFSTDESGSAGPQGDSPDKTPTAPESLKNELYFDRADQRCEWCGEHIDQPEVHHIVPRSEGGPNDPENLILLCPNHHRQADAGAIGRSKLRAKVRRQMGEA